MPLSIAYKELFPIILAVPLWGHQWSVKRVEFCSDNTAVVGPVRHKIRHLFVLTARHAAGKSNTIADTISCFEFRRLHQLAPYLSPTATPVPPLVLAQLPVI